MNKLLAVLLAALSISASAQSNVQVYGLIDAGYASTTSSRTSGADTRSGAVNSVLIPSRLGFKGTEQISDDLAANFVLEYNLFNTTNDGLTAAREQSIGLASKSVGGLKIGRMSTLGRDAIEKYDALSGSPFSPIATFKGTSIFSTSRTNNTFQYSAPTLVQGLTVKAAYANDTGLGSVAYGAGTPQENMYQIGADYTKGPVSVAYVYHGFKDLGRVDGANNNENFVGVKYKVSNMVTLHGTYQTDAQGSVRDAETAGVGAVFTLGQYGVATNYAIRNDKTAANADSSGFGVQGTYSLSKRTMVYAGYTQVSNKNGATFAAMGPIYGVATLGADAKSSGYGAGLVHRF
jgi:predicted porin